MALTGNAWMLYWKYLCITLSSLFQWVYWTSISWYLCWQMGLCLEYELLCWTLCIYGRYYVCQTVPKLYDMIIYLRLSISIIYQLFCERVFLTSPWFIQQPSSSQNESKPFKYKVLLVPCYLHYNVACQGSVISSKLTPQQADQTNQPFNL